MDPLIFRAFTAELRKIAQAHPEFLKALKTEGLHAAHNLKGPANNWSLMGELAHNRIHGKMSPQQIEQYGYQASERMHQLGELVRRASRKPPTSLPPFPAQAAQIGEDVGTRVTRTPKPRVLP